jgi:ankyrin repeat protein
VFILSCRREEKTLDIIVNFVLRAVAFSILIRDFNSTMILSWETFVWIVGRFLGSIGLLVCITMLVVILLYISYPNILGILKRYMPKYASRLDNFTKFFTVKLIEKLASQSGIFGVQSKQKILYVPNADQQPPSSNYNLNKSNSFDEISQDALSQHLLSKETANLIDQLNSDGSSKEFDKTMHDMLRYLKDFKKKANITEFEIYQSSMHWLSDRLGIHHTFIVFQTDGGTEKEYWWSLEKNTKYIVMQRSRNQVAVVSRFMRKNRKNVKCIGENPIKGHGTMAELLTTLWAFNITEKYHVVKANCQTFVQFIEKAYQKSSDFVNKQITSFESAVPYSTSLSNQKIDPIINLLTKFPEWPPLFAIVYLGDAVLLENFLCNDKNTKYTDVDLVAYDTTVLQLAILLSKIKMVEILLRNPNFKKEILITRLLQNEDPDIPWKGMSLLHTAAAFTGDTKIIDLLFKHQKVNKDTDASGRNALHIAAVASNVTTVNHLLKNCHLDPNTRDNSGLTPLHLAARHTDNTNIIDLLLKAKKTQETDRGLDDDDSQGRTALHHAVIGSNVTATRGLIEKGANPIQADRQGTTPLDLAVQQAKDMEIINLFLENKTVYKELKVKGGDRVFNFKNPNAGLSNEIEQRLRSKGIIRKLPIPPEANSETNPQTNPEINHGNNGEENGGENNARKNKPCKNTEILPTDNKDKKTKNNEMWGMTSQVKIDQCTAKRPLSVC